jgi:hypothetical protein
MRASRVKKAKKSAHMKDENPELRKVARALRNFVKRIVPGVKETVNAWGIPTFEAPNAFCFCMVGKNHVTFGFHFGTSLKDPERLLEGTGKNIRHVKLRTVAELEQKGLPGLVLAAARLNGKEPMKGMTGQRM